MLRVRLDFTRRRLSNQNRSQYRHQALPVEANDKWAQTPTEDYVRKKLAEEQRSAAVAAGKTRTDSHRLWLDKKYEKRTQKRLAKQSAKGGFS